MSDHQLAPGVTVEEVVRGQLAKALGGRRGMVEAAVPTIVFTVLWLTTRELQVALGVSVGVAVLLLVVRLVQRSTVQFVVNAIGWPLVGFMVGSVTGEVTEWHRDKQVVRLCTTLTWLLAVPCVVRVVLQAPLWLGGWSGSIDTDFAIAALGILKIALGWPLQLAALAGMLWVLGRNRTPVEPLAP